jgi:hypothetical protein
MPKAGAAVFFRLINSPATWRRSIPPPPYMKVLRWILFLPAAFICTAIPQLVAAGVAQNLKVWIAVVVMVPFNAIAIAMGLLALKTAPNRRVGFWIFVPLFLACEIYSVSKQGPPMSLGEWICRGLVDIGLLVGLIGSGFSDN